MMSLSTKDAEVCNKARIYAYVKLNSFFKPGSMNIPVISVFSSSMMHCSFQSWGTSHTPFERTSKSTYQFIASVALHRLIEDIPDSKCMYFSSSSEEITPFKKLYYINLLAIKIEKQEENLILHLQIISQVFLESH